MLRSRRVAAIPSASRAMSKPTPPSLRRSRSAIACSEDPAGQSHARGSRMSIPMTSAAPRRSISKAQNPSNVPMSRQRAPSSEAGSGTRETTSRRSYQPGVTTPGPSSSTWYHSRAATRCASSGSVGAATLTARHVSRHATGYVAVVADRAFPVIYAYDVERTAAFYTQLGFEEHFRLAPADEVGYIGLRRGSSEVAVVTHQSPEQFIGVEVGDRPRFELYVYVDDVDAELAALHDTGATVLREPEDMPWGARVAYVADP